MSSRRPQVSGLMMSLMETFSPSYLQPLPLRGLCMRACLNLVNNYRCGVFCTFKRFLVHTSLHRCLPAEQQQLLPHVAQVWDMVEVAYSMMRALDGLQLGIGLCVHRCSPVLLPKPCWADHIMSL